MLLFFTGKIIWNLWHVTKTKISRLGNKKRRSCGAWGYRMAARSGLSLGPIYLTPTTTHRKQEMTSKFLSLSFSLPLTRLRVPATSNTSPGQHDDQLRLDNS